MPVRQRSAMRFRSNGGTRPDAVTLTMGRYASDDGESAQGMVQIDGAEGASVQMGPCCRPIPGDAIVGYLGRGERIDVRGDSVDVPSLVLPDWTYAGDHDAIARCRISREAGALGRAVDEHLVGHGFGIVNALAQAVAAHIGLRVEGERLEGVAFVCILGRRRRLGAATSHQHHEQGRRTAHVRQATPPRI